MSPVFIPQRNLKRLWPQISGPSKMILQLTSQAQCLFQNKTAEPVKRLPVTQFAFWKGHYFPTIASSFKCRDWNAYLLEKDRSLIGEWNFNFKGVLQERMNEPNTNKSIITLKFENLSRRLWDLGANPDQDNIEKNTTTTSQKFCALIARNNKGISDVTSQETVPMRERCF